MSSVVVLVYIQKCVVHISAIISLVHTEAAMLFITKRLKKDNTRINAFLVALLTASGGTCNSWIAQKCSNFYFFALAWPTAQNARTEGEKKE